MEPGAIVTVLRDSLEVVGVLFERKGEEWSVFKTHLEPTEEHLNRLKTLPFENLFKYPLVLTKMAEIKDIGVINQVAKEGIESLKDYREKIKKLSFGELQVEAQELLGEGETAKYNVIIEECNRRHP